MTHRNSEEWSVKYTATLDDGSKHSWEETWDIAGDDKYRKAGNILLSLKYGSYSQVFDGKLYPAHRLREVVWEIL